MQKNIPEVEELVKLISKLPGLGPKSAKRIVLKLVNNREELVKPLTKTLAQVYKNVIPRNVRLSEAPSHGIPVLIYDKNCSGSKSYLGFADEFLKQESLMETAA